MASYVKAPRSGSQDLRQMQPILPRTTTDAALRHADEEILVARARAGDRAAFSALVDRHRPRVYAKAKALLGNDDAADDACQETFLRAYVNLAVLREPGAFVRWLLTIATNVCKHELRAPRTATSDLMLESLADATNDFERSELRADLTSLIDDLSPRMAVLARLHYLKGLDQDDVASRLGIPLGTVSSAVTRARNEIRAHVERRRRREAGLRAEDLRVGTQGVLATLCPFCGRYRLEWRRLRLAGSDRVDTFCPQCSSNVHEPVTSGLLSRNENVPEGYLLTWHRRLFRFAGQVLTRSGQCPTCAARLIRVPSFAHSRRPGEARVAWRCAKCGYEADSSAAALLLGSAPVERFRRENEAILSEDRDGWVRVHGAPCWRLRYRAVRSQARLTVLADVSSLRLLSAQVDYGTRSIASS